MNEDDQIAYERHVARILEIRKPPAKEKSTLTEWLNSSVITALIGVLGTAVIGSLITAQVQNTAQSNEQARTRRAARIQSQNDVVAKILQRTGAFLSATDDLLVTVNSGYDERGRKPEDAKKLRAWKVKLSEQRDQADLDWRRDRHSLTFTVHYVFAGAEHVTKSWEAVVRAIDGFEKCTNTWYTANAHEGTVLTPDLICGNERETADRAVEAFTLVVGQERNLLEDGTPSKRSLWGSK